MKRNATPFGTEPAKKELAPHHAKHYPNRHISYNSRFAEGVGTKSEELIAAAHAGFSQ